MGTLSLHGIQHMLTVDHFAEHDMRAIQPRRVNGADKELGSVSAWTGVGHGQNSFAHMCQVEVFVFKPVAIDALPTCAVTVSEVTALAHELWDDAVKRATLVVQRLALTSNALLARAQSSKVLSGFWNFVREQLDNTRRRNEGKKEAAFSSGAWGRGIYEGGSA